MSNLRIPRASIDCRFNKDVDTKALHARGASGRDACYLFLQLIIEAKDLRNNGEFVGQIDIYAPALGLTPARAKQCVKLIADVCTTNGTEPWIEVHEKGFRLRSFSKFNSPPKDPEDDKPQNKWGGSRTNAGRKKNQDCNQDDSFRNQDDYQDGIKRESRGCASVNVSVSDSEEQQQQPRATGRKRADSGLDLVDPKDPNAGTISHVCRCLAQTMRLMELRPNRNEPQTVALNVREWLSRQPPTIHGQVRTMDEVVRRAADETAKSEIGGTVRGAISWCESIIDRVSRDGVWPGEYKQPKQTGETVASVPDPGEYRTPEQRRKEREARGEA